MPNATQRSKCLDAAKAVVCGDRDEQYGQPEDTFAHICNLWMVYLAACGIDAGALRNQDVAIMLGLLKMARIACGQTHADNYVDLAGYAACAAELALPLIEEAI